MKLRGSFRSLKRYVSDFCKDWEFAIRTGSQADMAIIRRLEKRRYCRITESHVRTQYSQEKAYTILEKEYGALVAAAPDSKPDDLRRGVPKIIWWCWLQGLENAPELTLTCLESVRKYMPGYDIRIITEKNWRDYVDMPDYVLDRLDKGLMSRTHFCDLLRLELLLRYGGVWIDATVLMTGDGLNSILKRTDDLFMPRFLGNTSGKTATNWLIAARADNDLLRLMQQLLYAYWKDHKLAIQYFIFHLFFTMVANRYPEQWYNVYPYIRDNSALLFREMNHPFSAERYEELKEAACFHKLSWKKAYDDSPGTFYDVLIHQKLY